ncbi:MAG: peptide/nickel transport system substrate-binding protein [Candidatus Eremiobacteraeota bacterium]|nr:peptide/nickel transport system substrate-binding protein [Candidatus Eremiobacteraeota bacterium]
MVYNEPLRFFMRKSAALALGTALLLPVCTDAGGAQVAARRANAWTTPHVLTISDGGDVTTLNPHLSQFASVANLSEMTMAWLLKWDARNQPYPELATAVPTKANGGISKDGLTITYHLRKGVKWSDGAPFDADDVVFSTAVVNDPANDEGTRFDQIAKVDEPDKFTVVYHLKKPYSLATVAYFSSCCANPSVLPKHLLARYPNINDVPYNALPVGIGPFTFERWDRSKQVVLVANPLYWRGRPKLDKIVYKIVADRNTLLSQLKSHGVDMWYQFSGAYLERIQALPGYAIFRQPSYAYSHYDFNVTHPPVSDPLVRQALRLALDRQAIVDKVEHGVGIVQDAATPRNAPYFVDMGTTPYDPAKANALLDQGGWARGPDGIRAKNGVRLDLNVATRAGTPEIDEQIELVRNDWKQIGVGLNVRRYPAALMFAPVQKGGVINGDAWDVITFAWAADPLGDYSAIYGCNAFPPTGQNDLRWCNRTVQGAMDALVGHYEQSERIADLKVIMREFIKDAPSIVSFLRVDLFAYNSDLKNYHPNNITPFDNMMDVDI